MMSNSEKSLNEWAQSRAKGVEEEPPRVEAVKRCPFSTGSGGSLHVDESGAFAVMNDFGGCTDDCAVYFDGKCALTAIAEAMC